jgi:hypothetical protein
VLLSVGSASGLCRLLQNPSTFFSLWSRPPTISALATSLTLHSTLPKSLYLLLYVRLTRPYSLLLISLSSPTNALGNASRIMYATSSNPQQGHNPHYDIPHIRISNGHASPSNQNGNSNHPPQPQPVAPTQSQRSAQPAAVAKEPITVVGVPSVSIQANHLVVGSSQSSQYSRL